MLQNHFRLLTKKTSKIKEKKMFSKFPVLFFIYCVLSPSLAISFQLIKKSVLKSIVNFVSNRRTIKQVINAYARKIFIIIYSYLKPFRSEGHKIQIFASNAPPLPFPCFLSKDNSRTSPHRLWSLNPITAQTAASSERSLCLGWSLSLSELVYSE